MEKIEKYRNKQNEIVTVTHNNSVVRIKVEGKAAEEIITKDSFYKRMERNNWEPLVNGNKKT